MRRLITAVACLAIWMQGTAGQNKGPLVETVADTGFIQLEARSFAQLDARQKTLTYWLMQASIAIDPIIYDQLSRFGLREKRLLEGVMAHQAAVNPAAFTKIREYARCSGRTAAITTKRPRRSSCRRSRRLSSRTRR